MAEQLSIFDRVPANKATTVEEKFSKFIADNPGLMQEMLRLARVRLDRGDTFISVKALWEELRVSMRTKHGDDYALNNNYTALAARALLELEPRLHGVMHTRKRTSL